MGPESASNWPASVQSLAWPWRVPRQPLFIICFSIGMATLGCKTLENLTIITIVINNVIYIYSYITNLKNHMYQWFFHHFSNGNFGEPISIEAGWWTPSWIIPSIRSRLHCSGCICGETMFFSIKWRCSCKSSLTQNSIDPHSGRSKLACIRLFSLCIYSAYIVHVDIHTYWPTSAK